MLVQFVEGIIWLNKKYKFLHTNYLSTILMIIIAIQPLVQIYGAYYYGNMSETQLNILKVLFIGIIISFVIFASKYSKMDNKETVSIRQE